MEKIRIAIVDGHETSRKALSMLFNEIDDFVIVLQAHNGLHFLDLLKTETPDLALMEITMPEMGGMETTDRARELYPNLKIIAYSQHSAANVIEMNIRGVKSFIGKEDHPDELIKAIRIVYSGGVYMTDVAAAIVQKHLSNISKYPQTDFDGGAISQLSGAELKVLWCTSQHKSSKEIAETLFISWHTVSNHQAAIRHKLNLTGRNSLLRYALNVKEILTMIDGRVELKK